MTPRRRKPSSSTVYASAAAMTPAHDPLACDDSFRPGNDRLVIRVATLIEPLVLPP